MRVEPENAALSGQTCIGLHPSATRRYGVRRVNHPHHDHPDPNLVNLFARLFEFFSFYVVHASVRWDLIYKLFD